MYKKLDLPHAMYILDKFHMNQIFKCKGLYDKNELKYFQELRSFPIARVARLRCTEASPLQETCLSLTVPLSDLADTLSKADNLQKKKQKPNLHFYFPEKS